MERGQDRAAAFAEHEWLSALRVAPTCPPSQLVHVRGGRTYLGGNFSKAVLDAFEERAYTIPDLTADLADPASVTVTVEFSTVNYYQFFLLEITTPAEAELPEASDWSFYLHGTGDEFATGGEAEQWLHSEDFQYSEPWDHYADGIMGYPLCGVVLRNDGQVDVSGAFLPIDVVNRGRSYLWPRDMRPLQLMSS